MPEYQPSIGFGGVGTEGFPGMVVMHILISCFVDSDCSVGYVCISEECSLPGQLGDACDGPDQPADCAGGMYV